MLNTYKSFNVYLAGPNLDPKDLMTAEATGLSQSLTHTHTQTHTHPHTHTHTHTPTSASSEPVVKSFSYFMLIPKLLLVDPSGPQKRVTLFFPQKKEQVTISINCRFQVFVVVGSFFD